jgi:hypothetical protein
MQEENKKTENYLEFISNINTDSKSFHKNPDLIKLVNNVLIPEIQNWTMNKPFAHSLPAFLVSMGISLEFVFAVALKFPVLKKALVLAIESTEIKILNSNLSYEHSKLLINYYRKLYSDHINYYSDPGKRLFLDDIEKEDCPVPRLEQRTRTIRLITNS